MKTCVVRLGWLLVAAILSVAVFPAPRPLPVRADSDAEPLSLLGQIGGRTYDLAVDENFVYLAAGPRVQMLDISDPAQPRLAAQSDLMGQVFPWSWWVKPCMPTEPRSWTFPTPGWTRFPPP